MLDAILAIALSVFVAVVSRLIVEWWKGWRWKARAIHALRRPFQRIGLWRDKRKMLIFVSFGGTCRDPIAKVITEKLIRDGVPKLRGLRVEGRALMNPPSHTSASHAAQVAIREILGEDLLKGYVPASITREEIEHADLILVMSKDLIQKDLLPAGKTYLFKEFFGLMGDIQDPWPDGHDQQTLNRYRECAEEIKEILESGMRHLVRVLGS